MKRIWLTAVLAALCLTTAWGTELPRDVTEAVPPEAAELLQDVGDTADHETLWTGLGELWRSACGYVRTALESRISGAAVLLGIVLLCSVAESFSRRRTGQAYRNSCPWPGRWL